MLFFSLSILQHLVVLIDSESTVGEKTKRTKTKEAFAVTFDESVDLDWSFKVTRAATTVTKVTLEKHSKQQTTLPEDLHYDANQLMRLTSMPPVMASHPLLCNVDNVRMLSGCNLKQSALHLFYIGAFIASFDTGVRKSIWVIRCRCRLFAHGPADAITIPKPIISCLFLIPACPDCPLNGCSIVLVNLFRFA